MHTIIFLNPVISKYSDKGTISPSHLDHLTNYQQQQAIKQIPYGFPWWGKKGKEPVGRNFHFYQFDLYYNMPL